MDLKYDGDTVHVTDIPHVKFSVRDSPSNNRADEKESHVKEQATNGNEAPGCKDL